MAISDALIHTHIYRFIHRRHHPRALHDHTALRRALCSHTLIEPRPLHRSGAGPAVAHSPQRHIFQATAPSRPMHAGRFQWAPPGPDYNFTRWSSARTARWFSARCPCERCPDSVHRGPGARRGGQWTAASGRPTPTLGGYVNSAGSSALPHRLAWRVRCDAGLRAMRTLPHDGNFRLE